MQEEKCSKQTWKAKELRVKHISTSIYNTIEQILEENMYGMNGWKFSNYITEIAADQWVFTMLDIYRFAFDLMLNLLN